MNSILIEDYNEFIDFVQSLNRLAGKASEKNFSEAFLKTNTDESISITVTLVEKVER